ncbi:MAG: 1-acyl-sn-glycerol-3-phosphate acyltransferase [Bacteroidetes bacterium]|nr:1-acyl-sn-glycerol-3-phosphate acyltransferase [Bacteroidota bacterium]
MDSYKKPILLAVAPHTNIFDIIIVPAALPRHLLPVRWLADRKLFTRWYKRIWLCLWGAVPVSRSITGRFKEGGKNLILQMLNEKQTVAIFPECCLVGGSFSEIHQELFSSVINNNITVLPVNVQGIKALKPRNFIWEKLNTARLVFGTPIKNSDNQVWSSASVMASIVEGFFIKE